MKIKRPITLEEYIELVDQAIFEVSDLRSAIEYDGDYMAGASDFVQELEQQLTALLNAIKDGSYEFNQQDLPFMPLVNNVNDILLPFKHLLRQINNTHTLGLDS